MAQACASWRLKASMKSATTCRIAAESTSVDFDCAFAREMANENEARRITAKAALAHVRVIMPPSNCNPSHTLVLWVAASQLAEKCVDGPSGVKTLEENA